MKKLGIGLVGGLCDDVIVAMSCRTITQCKALG